MIAGDCAAAIHARFRSAYVADRDFSYWLDVDCLELWLNGYMYHFIALTQSGDGVMTLFYLPFGKLFHVAQRPVDWRRALPERAADGPGDLRALRDRIRRAIMAR